MNEELVTPEVMEAMGISQPALEEVQSIIGRMPTVEELSTLLAMWEANGRQQSLYGWLRGQHHVVDRREYLYTGDDTDHKSYREPRVKDCIPLAKEVMHTPGITPLPAAQQFDNNRILYMVGDVATGFLDSEYARRCLHLVDNPVRMESADETDDYLRMILSSLHSAEVLCTYTRVSTGGLFATLCRACRPKVGFDILTCREVRLDAFLFGEDGVRYTVSLPEEQDDFFLLKLDEARVNCCFLGHTTKGRLLIDDMDYGDIGTYLRKA